MPHTICITKALDLGLKPCVVINKVDKENCTLKKFMRRSFDLMFELGAEEWQLDFPTVYGSAKNNWMSDHWENVTDNVEALLDMVFC
jgi:GTP-binding protein